MLRSLFGQLWGIFGLLFIPTSSHTQYKPATGITDWQLQNNENRLTQRASKSKIWCLLESISHRYRLNRSLTTLRRTHSYQRVGHGALYDKEMINWIGPKAKHIWIYSMHVRNKFLLFFKHNSSPHGPIWFIISLGRVNDCMPKSRCLWKDGK